MTSAELDALIAQGADALQAALASGSLSGEETQIVQKALAKIAANVEAEKPEGVVETIAEAVAETVETVKATVRGRKATTCKACSHAAHEGQCPYTTNEYECDCVQ